MRIKIHNYKPLDAGYHQFTLKSLEEKETIYGNRLMWVFEEVEHGAEVIGFTSLSPSTMANAYKWAVALNPEIHNQRSWTEEDVVRRDCRIKVDIVQASIGPKNRIVEVLPVEE